MLFDIVVLSSVACLTFCVLFLFGRSSLQFAAQYIFGCCFSLSFWAFRMLFAFVFSLYLVALVCSLLFKIFWCLAVHVFWHLCMFDVFVFCFYSVALVCSLLLKIFWRAGFHCRVVHVCMFDALCFVCIWSL